MIYYHFGNSKAAILTECLDVIAQEYYGFTPARMKMVREGKLLESLLLTRRLFLDHPHLAVFYQKWRMTASPLQKQFIAIERKYQLKLAQAFPHLTRTQVEAVHGFFHGLISAPFLSEAALAEGFAMVFRLAGLPAR